MTPFIVQRLVTQVDRNGNSRAAWAVYQPSPPEPYRLTTSEHTVEAERSYAELVAYQSDDSGALLLDCWWLIGRAFVLMPNRAVSLTEMRRMARTVGRVPATITGGLA